MIKPNDLGKTTDSLRAVKLDDLVREAKNKFKEDFIKSNFEIEGIHIALTTSKTRFDGRRFWFICPICLMKRGVIYKDTSFLGCRVCLNLKYRQHRYKGMIELQNYPTM